MLLPFEKSNNDQAVSMFDQRSANEKGGYLPQAHEITCQHISNKHTANDSYCENSCSSGPIEVQLAIDAFFQSSKKFMDLHEGYFCQK